MQAAAWVGQQARPTIHRGDQSTGERAGMAPLVHGGPWMEPLCLACVPSRWSALLACQAGHQMGTARALSILSSFTIFKSGCLHVRMTCSWCKTQQPVSVADRDL